MMAARIGVVGIGWWATINHIPAIAAHPDAELVAICDLDESRVRAVGAEFSIPGLYVDLARMLATERLDGLIVSTPHVAHTAPTLAGLAAGAHVLVEKPMATTAAAGRAIAQAARAAGRQVMIPTAMSFTRACAQAAAAVRAGRIGRVRHAVCQMGSALEDLFAGAPMLETAGHPVRPPASTWADPARAGGYGWGQLSHALGWLVHVADIRFEMLYCLDGKSPAGVDYYDAAVGRTTDGATVSLSGAATVPKQRGLHFDIRIYGSDGMIFFASESGRGRLEISRLDGGEEALDFDAGEADYDGMLPVRRFADLCAGKPVDNPADAEVGARVTEALAAMYRSAASGLPERTGD
jgi:predicted dehydrogenase